MRTLSADVTAETRKLHNPGPWYELWRIQIDANVTNVTWAALVTHDQPVTFDGVVYYPYDLKRGHIRQSSDGSLSPTTLALSNITRESASWAEIGEGFRGRPVELRIVHSAHLGGAQHAMQFDFTCASPRVNSNQITLELRDAPLFEVSIPHNKFSADRCPWVYKSRDGCLYTGAIVGCDKSLGGANGCRVHGEDEIAAGLPSLHPLLFGGFPGVATGVNR